jgi:hypothetical protein
MTRSVCRPALLAVLLSIWPGAVVAHQAVTAPRGTEAGRVVAIVTALEGTVRVANADVELISIDGNVTLAKTTTDGAGQVTFADVPLGRYLLKASRPGFAPTDSAAFEVRVGAVAQVLLDIRLAFVEGAVEVRPASPTESVQPVSSSDMLSGSVLDIAPLEGDDFQSLLPLLPGVVRGPDGRLRAKGGQATQGALQISSTSLIDPSTGEFDLELPGQSLESVETLTNPFAAEYGRFSTSLTQIRTRRGTNEWEIEPGNLIPRLRKGFDGIRGFEPRFSVRGPLQRDRLFLAQDFQLRYLNEPVKSLPDEPEIGLRSFDSFTRVDGVLSTRHTLGGLVVMFPRRVEHLTMNTFRPAEATPEFKQNGISLGLQDRFAISPTIVLESTLAGRGFEIEVNTDGRQPMAYTPESQQGSFFNDQEREVRSVQWVETVSVTLDRWRGSHLFKFGFDFQHSRYDGTSGSRTVEIRRLDGSLAEHIAFGPPTRQSVTADDLALFAQDQWRVGSRVTLEFGLRMDREDVIGRVNWSPRGGASVGVLPEGRGILRGGIGRFRQRTPLNVGAFRDFESRMVTRFGSGGEAISGPIALNNVPAPDLRTPEAVAGNVEWSQRFGRRVLFKVNYLRRRGAHEYVLEPDPERSEIRLQSTGRSRYWEVEVTGRYLKGERSDVTVSYVRSRGFADLNNYDQFYGNVRNPIVRPNEHNLIPTDVPHRLLLRGSIGLPHQWDFAPVVEIRSGFPWSAVNQYQDFIGPRNRTGRLPIVRTVDFSVSRQWQLWKYRVRGGIRVYNLLGASAERDVQNNSASPRFGQFFNPIERSIGFILAAAR